MTAKLQGKDIIVENPFGSLKKEILKVESGIKGLENTFIDLKTTVESITFDKNISKAITDLNKAETQMIKNQAELIKKEQQKVKLDADLIKLEKAKLDLLIKSDKELERLIKLEKKESKEKEKSKKLSDEEIKDKIKLQKVNAKRKKDLEAEIILERKSINNRNELKETIKALRLEADKLDLGSDELESANAEIDELDAKLRETSDQFTQNKIDVGNYRKATEELTDSFEDQNKKLKILTDTYKDAVSQGKKNTKQAKELRAELKKQEEAIKSVEEATEDATDKSKKFGDASKALGIGLVIAIIAKLAGAFGESREASIEAEKKMAIFTETVKVLFASAVNAFEGIKTIGKSLFESLESGALSFEKGYINMLITIEKGKGIFSDTTQEVAKLEAELKGINDQQQELSESQNTLAKGAKQVTDAFKDQGETTEKAIKFQQDLLELQLKTEISIQRQTRALAGLAEERQILQDISDDDTLGFETRADAVARSQKNAEEFAKKEIELARTKEKLTIQVIKGELLRSNIISENELKSIKTGEQLNALLARRGVALKVSNEAEQAFTDAFVERNEKQIEAQSFSRDQEEKNRKTFRDSYEQRLDIIEEFGELQFALNEELLNNDKATQEERNAVFAKNQKLSQDLLKEGIALTIEQGKKSIDLNKKLSDAEKETAKANLDKININEILNAQSEQERFEIIRRLDLGEIEEKRLKETFKIRFEQNKALIEQQEALKESNRANLELEREIFLQEIALKQTTNKKLEELDESRFELEKQNLRERIELLKEDSNARLELEKQLNDLLLTEQEKLLEKDKENKQKKEDFVLKFLDAEIEAQKRLNQEKLNIIDAEILASQKQVEALRQAAKDGIADSKENLATAQQQEAEARAKKTEELKKQKRDEEALVFLKLIAASADRGSKNPLVDALVEFAAYKVASRGLPSFDVGSDRLGKEGQSIDGKGGFIAINHPDEKIMTAEHNKEMGYATNSKVVENFKIAEQFKTGELDKNYQSLHVHNSYQSNEDIVKGLSSVEKAINRMPKNMPSITSTYNPLKKALTEEIKQENKRDRYITKVGQGGLLGG